MSVSLAFALVLSPQAAPSAADLADAKCIAAINFLESHYSQQAQADMMLARYFFLGKIAGRSGGASVQPALQAEYKQLERGGTSGTEATLEQCMAQLRAELERR